MTTQRILALTRYGSLGASSRLRFFQYFPYLRESSIEVTHHALFGNDELRMRYKDGRYSLLSLIKSYFFRIKILLRTRLYDVVWIEKEALPWLPLWLEKLFLKDVPYVLDFDDAVFHNYDQNKSTIVRTFYKHRLDRLMAGASLVVGGNPYLVHRASEAGAHKVEMIPTVVNLNDYPLPSWSHLLKCDDSPRIVWIGSPATIHYLELLREPLKNLSAKFPFVLRIIGGVIDIPGVKVELFRWTEESQFSAIASADIGVMPLLDSPWERGKCGYKLIQYMACELPVVASPIGVNTDIVKIGRNGFLASNTNEWMHYLEMLLLQPALRSSMGKVGRGQVESIYSLQATAPHMINLLKLAAQGS